MNRDFVEMLCALNDARADYLFLGARGLENSMSKWPA